MSNLWPRIEPLLARVEKPARYIGMERGAVRPAWAPGQVAFLLIYPDTYEIGLPNQGLQILYEILNERPDALAERAYAPWTDMDATLRAPRAAVVQRRHPPAATDFDVLAFNLSAELVYTNLLECVDLAGVPVRNEDRRPEHPIVVAGGHCAYNPEPLAEYVDAFVMGDGEEVIGEVAEVVGAWKRAVPVASRDASDAVLRELATIDGVYVPDMYEVEYDGAAIREIRPRFADVPARVDKRTVADLAEWPYPKQQLVPLVEVVHDRLNVEIFRGCTRGCRFCQAGMITRPVRERPEEQVRTMVREGLRRTGYDEVALTSLSSADFSGIDAVVADLVGDQEGTGGVSVSLPSLRVDAFSVCIASEIQKVRRTGLTFAPEAGSWRLRQVINKLILEDDLYSAVDAAYSQGWRRVKLYFLTGLPTEMDEDTLGIAELAKNVIDDRPQVHQAGELHGVTRRVRPEAAHAVPVVRPERRSTSCGARSRCVRDATKGTRAQVKWHDPAATFAEGIASRGDRRIGRVIERVWRAGGTFQEWSEHFRARPLARRDGTPKVSTPTGTSPGTAPLDEVLPWDHVTAGLHKDFLWQDWQASLAAHGLPDCRWTPCYDCGVCTDYAHRARRGVAGPPGRRESGHGPGSGRGRRDPRLRCASSARNTAGRSG